MKNNNWFGQSTIFPAPSIQQALSAIHLQQKRIPVRRTLFITCLAGFNALLVGFIAKALVQLIDFCTGLFFYGRLTASAVSPAGNHLGPWVILVPVSGGLIVGVMARYGSKAIRGHGIPEAMEKILTAESKIPPLITFLKPLSAAISIGTGGPFGAEGPIIATGGAFGSLCGQTLHTTAQERKILLAAGAAAGMTAIFGSPLAAILLAIELLLFEFSPKSFVPVVVACVAGACMHFLLFGTAPTFAMPPVSLPGRNAVLAYVALGLFTGFVAVLVTKTVYWIEDAFEKLPIHWMWWPALGGLVVGVTGYWVPQTLGVGYSNISSALSGTLTLNALVALCLFKFISWSVALGSGTSGGTLAPLLTIGGALGCMLGMGLQMFLPQAHVSLPLAALVGMAALFAGASRALLTAIVFALEVTMQENTLLPLIAGCASSYLVSFVLMKGTIMTEKINRRGVATPDSYRPDVLQTTLLAELLNDEDGAEKIPLISAGNTIAEARAWLQANSRQYNAGTLIVIDSGCKLVGAVDKRELKKTNIYPAEKISGLELAQPIVVYNDNNLQVAVHALLHCKFDVLPVIDRHTQKVSGAISAYSILQACEKRQQHDTQRRRHISTRRHMLRIILKGKQLFTG